MFDYKGYSKEKLYELCWFDNGKDRIPYFGQMDHSGREFYSLSLLIKKFGYYPPFLKANVFYEHGVCFYEHVLDEQIVKGCDTYLTSSKWREGLFKPYYKNVKTIMFPYLFYRRKNDIKQVENPKGTLFFAAHEEMEDEVGYANTIINYIKNLPEEFSPVCVCLHVSDVGKEKFLNTLLSANIPIYTAGAAGDVRYVKRFYYMLKHFKYTLGTTIGSNVFYALDLGIPFAYIEKDIDIKNPDYAVRMKDYYKDGKRFPGAIDYEYIRSLFNIDITKEMSHITKEQKELTEKIFGVNDSISRLECAKYLWRGLFKWETVMEFFKYFLKHPLFMFKRRFIRLIMEYIDI